MSIVRIFPVGVKIFMEISSRSISIIVHGISWIIGHHNLSSGEIMVWCVVSSHKLIPLMVVVWLWVFVFVILQGWSLIMVWFSGFNVLACVWYIIFFCILRVFFRLYIGF